MRIILKILLFPITLILSIVVAVSAFIIGHVGWILNIISSLLFLLATITLFYSLYDGSKYGIQSAIIGAVVAFAISPFGVPLLAEWAIEKVDNLNDVIKSI